MPSSLHNRLGKLEKKIGPPDKPRKIFIVGSDEEEEAARRELELEGDELDDKGPRIICIRGVRSDDIDGDANADTN